MLNRNNHYEGFFIDIFNKIEFLLGIKFEYVYYKTWDELLFAGENREIDIVFSAQKNETLLLYYDFTDSILKQENKIMMIDDSLSNMNRHIMDDIGYNYNLRIASRNDMPILNVILTRSVEMIPLEYIKTLRLKWGYTQDTNNKTITRIIFAFSALFISILLWVGMLRRDKKKLEQILDTSIASMAIFKNGKCVHVNKGLLAKTGYSKKEILGKEIKDLVPDTKHKELSNRLETSQNEYEMVLKRKNGETYPALIRGTNIDGNRRISSFIDISEIKKVQEELELFNTTLELKIQGAIDKNKKQEQILSHQARLAQMGEAINMIAHQWRQPLSHINALVMLIDMKASKKDKSLDKELDEIEALTKYMSNTIDDFRDFFRPTKSKIEFNLIEIIETTFNLINPTLLYDDIKIQNYYKDEVSLLGYPNELGQVIISIVNNAKDALLANNNNSEKYICTKVYKEYKKIVISIEDNAGGIDETIHQKIFDAYFSTKLTKNGTGLGLYISKVIIEDNMGGELSVENSDVGAVFKIKFDLS